MEQSGPNWKWPKNVDEIWYDKSDVFKKIDPTGFVPVSKRRGVTFKSTTNCLGRDL